MNRLFLQDALTNLSITSRIIRLSVGVLLILAVMAMNGINLGSYALLPLVSIYWIITAINGCDPIKLWCKHDRVGALVLSSKLKIALLGLGVVSISSVFFSHGEPLGLMSLLPLVGIYPVFAAIIGSDPIDVLFNRGYVQERIEQSIEFQNVNIAKLEDEVTQHHHDLAA